MPRAREDTATLDERSGAKARPEVGPTDTTWPRASTLRHDGATAGETEWLPRAEEEEAPGTLLGAYRILRPIGQGGMATVYLAERCDGEYRRHVAIKMISAGLHSNKELVTRFRAERQVLADLDHPNVVRLLDGGTAPDGRPYMVMEHVDGMPIHDYCRRHGLTLTKRLELLYTVCLAVDHAHSRQVVHRDVKPQNVLVTRDGVVKLLDFGIAKLLGPEARPYAGSVTGTGLQPMTPGYASPEQICGDEITPASDVYALGLLAYKLLTDRLPYGDTRHRGWRMRRMERFLRKEPPTKPSAAGARDASSKRAGGPRRAISPDLDAIVMKALSLEPEDRYATAGELADDVSRYLRRRPVLARAPAPGARLPAVFPGALRRVVSAILQMSRNTGSRT